jgi:hypothetical protein
MRLFLNWMTIFASAAAAIFWALSAMQPLTLTLDALEAELKSAAWYNQKAAWAACAAAAFQVLAGILDAVRIGEK